MNNIFSTACPDLVEVEDGSTPCTHYVRGGFCTLPEYFRCIEYIAHHEPPLSYSAVDSYVRCHRKFYWQQIVGLESIEKSWAMQLGNHADLILQHLHSDKFSVEEGRTWYQQYISQLIESSVVTDDQDKQYGHLDFWKLKAMMDAYIKLEKDTLKGTTQYHFKWDIPDYPKVNGYIDFVQLLTYEQHIGFEFKYTSNPDNYSKFPISDQLMAYFIGEPALESIMVRCFVPPNTKPKQTTAKQVGESVLDYYAKAHEDILKLSKQKYFIDRVFYRSEFDLKEYKNKMVRVSLEVMNYIREGGKMIPFYQDKRACFSPYRCEFLLVCENDIKEPWTMTDTFTKRELKQKNTENKK